MTRTVASDERHGHGQDARGLLSMTWSDLLFAHWPVDPPTVAARLPDGYEVDTFDGDAYLGVVPFVMSDIGPSALHGVGPFSLSRSFGELNLRTYVRGPDGAPGVYFFNLDADDRLSVFLARSLFRLPYYRARMRIDRDGDEVRFRSRRTDATAPAARFRATYAPDGELSRSEPGSLRAFLTERYRFYTVDDAGLTYYGDIAHEPWQLAPARASFEENGLFAANGFEHPGGEPLLHHAADIEVTAGRIHRTRAGDGDGGTP
jgi:uncharacterized protein YqjF (DUF2071 family)